MIASVGPGLPQDLFAASGRYQGPLGWDAERATPQADRWLENKFPQWARAILEQWAAGGFDGLDVVVFSRADDASQRLYYYLCELRRTGAVNGPEPLLLDISKVPRASSLDHTIADVRKLARRLEVADAALEDAIIATNAARCAIPAAGNGRACLLAGTPPPDRRLHEAIEAAGFVAVGPTLADAWKDLGPLIDENSGDPIAAIGRQLHARPDEQRGFANTAAAIADQARAACARAAVLWYTEEDEARIWSLPAIRAALADIAVPALTLTRSDWAARDGAADEIRTFLGEVSA